MVERLWWLASYPKSGNTWLRMFLVSYSTDRDISINNVDKFSFQDITKYFYNSVSPVPLDELTPEQCLELRGAALLHMASIFSNPNRPQFIKTHSINDIGEKFIPSALTYGAVYLVRDPRDVVISYSEHNGLTIDKSIELMNKPANVHGQDDIFQITGAWSENVLSWCRPSTHVQTFIVKYEDLLEKPEKYFKDILNFLRVEYVEKAFNKALDETTFEKLKAQEEKAGIFAEKKHQDKFFKRGTKGHWKDILSPEQADRIVNDHGKVMEMLGYLDSKAKAA